jgi:polyphosphate kinase 2
MSENHELLAELRELIEGDLGEVSKKFDVPKMVIDQARGAEPGKIISPNYPYPKKIARREYESRKKPLQIELVKLQRWVKETRQKLVVLFEGRDAAGKGGAIQRFTEHMNPRGARVVALEKPSDSERTQWYFQRYIRQLPEAGEIVFFDRSWYNRAGVERVMGFCTDEEYAQFYRQVTDFEKMLVDSGIHLVKFWFSVSRAEQLRRLIARTVDPLKQWKISPMDVASLGVWDKYTEAKEEMFERTDTDVSPWLNVRSDDKKRARINAIRYVLDQFDYDQKSLSNIPALDPLIVGRAKQTLHDK